MSSLITTDVQGFDELIKKLTQLGDVRKTRRAMIAIHRPVLRPVVAAYRNEVPSRSSTIQSGPRAGKKQHKNNKFGPLPNLKKSVGIIAGKNPTNVQMYVGLRAGSRYKNDGWYGRMIHYGFQTRDKKQVPGNPFKDRAWRQSGVPATKKALDLATKQIDKQIKKLSK